MKKLLMTLLACCMAAAINAKNVSVPDPGPQNSQAVKPPNPTPSQVPVPAPVVPIEVYGVYCSAQDQNAITERPCAGLGDKIIIKVHGFTTLMAKANPPGCIKKDIKLFLDGRQIDDITPISGAPLKDEGELTFELKRTTLNDKAWTGILGAPGFQHFFLRPTKISVGIDGGYAENSTIKEFNIIRIRQYWFIACVVGLAFYIFMVFRLAKKTDMLKDPGTDLSPLGLTATTVKPYSLGRVQMAFWFSIVLASFLFIWLITGNYDLITPGVLGLIGISATTALGAITIDNSKGQDTIKAVQDLQQQEGTLKTDIHTLQAIPTPDAATQAAIVLKQTTLAQAQADIAKKLQALQVPHDSFINDILADVNGISFHRLQMGIWTIVLGIIFIYSVWASLVMPDFSANLLALQGITAGTYLGFKFPEKQA